MGDAERATVGDRRVDVRGNLPVEAVPVNDELDEDRTDQQRRAGDRHPAAVKKSVRVMEERSSKVPSRAPRSSGQPGTLPAGLQIRRLTPSAPAQSSGNIDIITGI